jgi:predicted aminopeptidase
LLGHEIAHEKLYFNGDTTFSELLASFIEKKIARDYLLSQRRPIESDTIIQQRQHRRLEFVELIMKLREQLEKLYASTASDAEKLRQKKSHIEEFRKMLTRRKDYFGIKEIPEINNAALVQFHRYTPQGKAFENLFQSCQTKEPEKPYVCWFRELEKLRGLSNTERKQWLNGDGSR